MDEQIDRWMDGLTQFNQNEVSRCLLSSVGIESEEERVSSLISALAEKNVEELIAEGKEKMSSVPTGGAVAASGAAAASSDAPAAEEKEEETEESDDDMGFGLFD